MTQVKICSVQETDHALAAARAGADFVGFNFVPGVRRQLPEEKAQRMIRACRERYGDRGPKLVGIFVDQPQDEVNRILDYCDLHMAQLSGHESLNYCLQIKRPVIKAVHVPMNQPADVVVDGLDTVLGELEGTDILPLLDPEVADAPGGTGNAFDWAIARELATRHRFLLAGGLTPENVAQAVKEVQPWGVDVSSGVESNGIKDVSRIATFVREAKALSVAR